MEENNKDNQDQEQEHEEETSDVVNKASPYKSKAVRFKVSPLLRRSGRQTQLPARLKDYALRTSILNIVEPTNYKEASQFDEWRATMNEEFESIIKNHTWDLVELPEGKIPIGCKWLYKPKFNADGSIEKFKSIFVTKGYSKKEGIDFEEIFSLIAKLNTIRMLIVLATKHQWKLH